MVSARLISAAVVKSLRLARPIAQTYAAATMTDSVRIEDLAAPVFNPSSGRLVAPARTLVYEGAASISTLSGPQVLNLGESPEYFSAAECQIPQGLDILPKVNNLLTVLTAADSSMVGRTFRVTDVGGGGAIPAMTRLELVGIEPVDQVEHG